ncbi:MAG: GNAT family N-acetyltransferase [Pseudomonadota bacterium]
MPLTLTDGFRPDQRGTATALFWEAFRGKLAPILRPEDKALRFLNRVADPSHTISATSGDTLLGIAGYKTTQGAFIGGELSDLTAIYGRLGGLWRGLALTVLERNVAAGTLLMDGIMVGKDARGQGVGTALLDAIKAKARTLGCTSVRLDVIDTNPRARALYERQGFVAEGSTNLGPLRHIFGFRTATTMVCPV